VTAESLLGTIKLVGRSPFGCCGRALLVDVPTRDVLVFRPPAGSAEHLEGKELAQRDPVIVGQRPALIEALPYRSRLITIKMMTKRLRAGLLSVWSRSA